MLKYNKDALASIIQMKEDSAKQMEDTEEQKQVLEKIEQLKQTLGEDSSRQVFKDLHIENLDTELIDHEKNISTLQNLDILAADKLESEECTQDTLNPKKSENITSNKMTTKTAWD